MSYMLEFDTSWLNIDQTYNGFISNDNFNDEFLLGNRYSDNRSMSFPVLSEDVNLLADSLKDNSYNSFTAFNTEAIYKDWLINSYFYQTASSNFNNLVINEHETSNTLETNYDIDPLTGQSYFDWLSSNRIATTEEHGELASSSSANNITDNNLDYSSVDVSGTIWAGDGYYPVKFWQYASNGRIDAPIDPNKETVVVIHGWNSGQSEDAPNGSLEELAMTVAQDSNIQVLALDWSQAAIDSTFVLGNLIPLDAASRIRPVAEWATQKLNELGIVSEQITLIGHSLGSYVTAEIGNILGGVKNVVALDPAFSTSLYDIDGRKPGQQSVTDFNQAATNSLALFAGESWLGGGLAGEATQAATAHNSLAIDFKKGNFFDNFINHHGHVIDVFTDAVSSNFLSLQNLSLPDHQNDWYSHSSQKLNSPIPRHHEGVISANKVGDYWDITNLKYIDLWGQQQTIWT